MSGRQSTSASRGPSRRPDQYSGRPPSLRFAPGSGLQLIELGLHITAPPGPQGPSSNGSCSPARELLHRSTAAPQCPLGKGAAAPQQFRSIGPGKGPWNTRSNHLKEERSASGFSSGSRSSRRGLGVSRSAPCGEDRCGASQSVRRPSRFRGVVRLAYESWCPHSARPRVFLSAHPCPIHTGSSHQRVPCDGIR